MTAINKITMQLVEQTRNRGNNFTAYTERDGGSWYMIAGERDSWHGGERVAESSYYGLRQRDKARAFLLFMFGIDNPAGMSFTLDQVRGISCQFVDQDGETITVWTREAARVFPEFATKHNILEES